MRRTVRVFLKGLRFAAVNRDLQPGLIRSCVEYWTLAIRKEFATLFGRPHDPNKPIHILGMKLYTFSLETLLYLINEIFLGREYAFAPVGDSPSIIDCGSNIGISILFFKKLLPRARIIGFEPDKKTFDLLSRNVTENRLVNVFLHNAALSSSCGEVTFFNDSQTPGSPRMSVVRERMEGEARQVPCVMLSHFMQEPVDLLKMDIEGSELDVMRELSASGSLKNVKEIVLEYHHHIRQDEDCLSQMLRLLEENSFGYDLGTAALPTVPGKFQDIQLRIYRKTDARADKRPSPEHSPGR